MRLGYARNSTLPAMPIMPRATRHSSHRPASHFRYSLLSTLVFFFFQAEDGIRDSSVTGVQTCALPIFAAAARALADSFDRKSDEFADVLKTGRTHLQDAVPMTLGQEFGGYAACVRRGAEDVAQASAQLFELNIGATAVGTGLNAGDEFRRAVVNNLSRDTQLPLQPVANLFRVTQSMGDVLAYSGA